MHTTGKTQSSYNLGADSQLTQSQMCCLLQQQFGVSHRGFQMRGRVGDQSDWSRYGSWRGKENDEWVWAKYTAKTIWLF